MDGQFYRVVLTESAIESLRELGKKFGKNTYETLRELIRDLEFDPASKGRALRHPLNGFHSLHYSRYRVIYRIENDEAKVIVIAAGHHASGDRGDIYQIIQRLVENDQLRFGPDAEEEQT